MKYQLTKPGSPTLEFTSLAEAYGLADKEGYTVQAVDEKINTAGQDLPHVVDNTIPIDKWEGYLCSVNGKRYKGGTSALCNYYCEHCGALLRNERGFPQ